MTKKSFAIYFGLVVLAMSLFASTAFASTATSINVKDVDAPARKPFQTTQAFPVPSAGATIHLTTVPANQRIVLEEVSGVCTNVLNSVAIQSVDSGSGTVNTQFLPYEFLDKISATSIRLYANPGEDLYLQAVNGGVDDGYCTLAVTGYYVNLP